MLEGVVPYDYDALCRQWSDDEDAVEGWRELRLALGGRNGWWFLDPRDLPGFDGGPMWCFGARDEANLCVTPASHTFEIYVAETDEEVSVDAIGEVVAWLDAHEPEELSPLLRQFFNVEPGPGDRRRR